MKGLGTLVVSAGLLVACSSRDHLHASLEKAARAGAESVTLRDHTDFEWDTVYVYGPYTPFEEINKKHHLTLEATGPYEGDFVSEGDCLYVFALGGQTVRTSFGPRHCSGIGDPGVYSAKEAVFGIKRHAAGWDFTTLSSDSALQRPGATK